MIIFILSTINPFYVADDDDDDDADADDARAGDDADADADDATTVSVCYVVLKWWCEVPAMFAYVLI